MNLGLAHKLIDVGACPRAVLRQYLAIKHSEGAKIIDISGFGWREIDFTNLDLHNVDVQSLFDNVEPQHRAALCKKFDNAILDQVSREHLVLIGSPTQIVDCPVPLSRRTLLDEDEELTGIDFRKLAVELQDMHQRGEFLGNIDLAHLRRHNRDVFYVKWETEDQPASQWVDECDSPVINSQNLDTRKQDQHDFFSAMVAACMPGQNKSLTIASFVQSLPCSTTLKSELTLFLLDPYKEEHVLLSPLEEYLEAPIERHSLRPVTIQPVPVEVSGVPVADAEVINIPVSSERVVSKSDSDESVENGFTGVRGSTAEKSAGPHAPVDNHTENMMRIRALFQRSGNFQWKREVLEKALKANILNQFLACIPDPNLSCVDLSNLDLSGIDFSFADLSYAKLDNTILANSLFRGAKLRGATLVGENMANADLRLAELKGATLTGTFTARMNSLAGARVINANLERAIIVRMIPALPGVNHHFQGTVLCNVSLAGLDLRFVDFRGATMDRVNVKGANLSFTCFKDASVNKVKFHKAKSIGNMIVNDKMLNSLALPMKEYLLYKISVGRVTKR
jgi:uncharacterized protein YjbI with pentapeptide repeats